MERTKVFTDTELNAFTLERLTENVHLEYVTDIEDAVDKCPAVEEQMPQLVADFKKAVADQKEAMQRLESGISKTDISAKAEARNKQQTAFKAWLRACQGLADPVKVAAATELIELAHKYDAHTGMGVDEQTGLLITMISAIEDHYMSQIEAIGAGELFNLLKQANQEVCDLQAQRDEEQAYRVDNTVSHFRSLTDRAYRRLVKGINAAAYIVDAEPFEALIAFINSVIRRYKNDHLKQPTPNPTIPDGDQSEGGELLPPEGEEGEETGPGGGTGGNGGSQTGPTETEEGPADGSKILLLFNDGAHGNVVVKRMEVAPGYQLSASDLPEGYVYAFKADDQADLDAAGAGDTVWVTLAPRG